MFSDDLIKEVWNKAKQVEGYSPDSYRRDVCGAWMMREAYGDLDSNYGWVIDHVYPVNKGGGNEVINLRAMHCKNNMAKGDDYPVYFSAISSVENRNIEVRKEFTVNVALQEKLNNLYKK